MIYYIFMRHPQKQNREYLMAEMAERATALDKREAELDKREAELDKREAELERKEKLLSVAGQQVKAGSVPNIFCFSAVAILVPPPPSSARAPLRRGSAGNAHALCMLASLVVKSQKQVSCQRKGLGCVCGGDNV